MVDPSPRDTLGATLLITGGNEFLAERTIDEVRSAVRAADRDADLSDLSADELGAGALAEVASPSLFAALRCVVVRGLEELPEPAVQPLLSYVASPADDVALVLRHSGGVKARSLLDKLRKAGAREVKAEALKRWELPTWVAGEFGSHQIRVDPAAANALVDSVGDDMRALAAAVDQLAADAEDRPVDEDVVRLYFGGRAEVKGFAVADAAIDGNAPDALEQLRWAFAAKVDPVLITSAVAGGLRSVARYASAPRGLREADLARHVGVPPWKLKTLSTQSRGWQPRGLALAIRAAARADADVKGAGGDRLWSCERLVISVVRARAVR